MLRALGFYRRDGVDVRDTCFGLVAWDACVENLKVDFITTSVALPGRVRLRKVDTLIQALM